MLTLNDKRLRGPNKIEKDGMIHHDFLAILIPSNWTYFHSRMDTRMDQVAESVE